MQSIITIWINVAMCLIFPMSAKATQPNLCQKPPDSGPCRDEIQKYYYNVLTKTCTTFVYGGCGGNDNQFDTRRQCNKICRNKNKLPASSNICNLPPESGPCTNYQHKFYYNSFSGSCEDLIYGGCQGNKNRFDTYRECQDKCTDVISDSGTHQICSLLPDTGSCTARHGRYFYNAFTRKCDHFIYSGCGGNKNNFNTIQECEDSCIDTPLPSGAKNVCTFVPEVGYCKDSYNKFYYSTSTHTCNEFTYSGCGGSNNVFDTQQECEDRCIGITTSSEYKSVCFLPLTPGTCSWYVPQYFYNATSQMCQRFTYRGCGGNENRCNSLAECKNRCTDISLEESNTRCYHPPKTGSCTYRLIRFYYNALTGTCEQFSYSGCDGNDNRFETLQECKEQCGEISQPSRPTNICNLPLESGPCNDYSNQFYYNSNIGTCESFIYGGCEGNANRFKTIQECQRKCFETIPQPAPNQFCLLPMDAGPCLQDIASYFLNISSRTCEPFSYSGCLGNNNRFRSKTDCLQICSPYAKPILPVETIHDSSEEDQNESSEKDSNKSSKEKNDSDSEEDSNKSSKEKNDSDSEEDDSSEEDED